MKKELPKRAYSENVDPLSLAASKLSSTDGLQELENVGSVAEVITYAVLQNLRAIDSVEDVAGLRRSISDMRTKAETMMKMADAMESSLDKFESGGFPSDAEISLQHKNFDIAEIERVSRLKLRVR